MIVLSGDLREELPVLFLRLRAGLVDGDLSLVELAPHATSPDAVRRGLPPRTSPAGPPRWPGP